MINNNNGKKKYVSYIHTHSQQEYISHLFIHSIYLSSTNSNNNNIIKSERRKNSFFCPGLEVVKLLFFSCVLRMKTDIMIRSYTCNVYDAKYNYIYSFLRRRLQKMCNCSFVCIALQIYL